ncbi:uncharacterized protein LOC141876348 [Acropora palmata]|uniref:uncharacterized protein LOC141876348 n=1 Tax=Acropora palmata TaxID=6131 RepID=UPI003DA1A9A9
MNIQVHPTSSNLASAMLNSKIRPRAVVGYGVKIFHPSPPNYVTRSPGLSQAPVVQRRDLTRTIKTQHRGKTYAHALTSALPVCTSGSVVAVLLAVCQLVVANQQPQIKEKRTTFAKKADGHSIHDYNNSKIAFFGEPF